MIGPSSPTSDGDSLLREIVDLRRRLGDLERGASRRNRILSLFDAKGDLLAGTADNAAARLAVGANGFGIVADSAQATGWRSSAGYSAGLEAARPTGAAGILYGATDTDRVWWHDGTGWVILAEPEQGFTPVWTNVTIGTAGASTGGTHRNDGWLDWWAKLVFGGAGTPTAITGSVDLNLPYALADAAIFVEADGYLLESTGGALYNITTQSTAAAANLRIYSGGVAPAIANLAAAAPFGWNAGDTIYARGRNRMNSRYS